LKRTFSNDLRRPKVHLSSFISNYIQERNPWTVVWWSAAFPGAGHMILCKYVSGALCSGNILLMQKHILTVECEKNKAEFVELLLWRHGALGVSKTF
jgi:hypothetical protein